MGKYMGFGLRAFEQASFEHLLVTRVVWLLKQHRERLAQLFLTGVRRIDLPETLSQQSPDLAKYDGPQWPFLGLFRTPSRLHADHTRIFPVRLE